MGVVDMSEHQKQTFAGNIISKLFNTVTCKKIAILGFAFKKDTGDVRETPAVTVCNMLLQDGANVTVYDPKVKREDALAEFKYQKKQLMAPMHSSCSQSGTSSSSTRMTPSMRR